ncbi:unnamed protein product [Thlaspi arvense]|uniref:Uncharacterized protein n=1 Tax=Thlaspi arvense TaxID=13288 RepID=A0AAU9SH85_THLAR|nr:unnamed protein product [Thlaspi arvense]
MELSCGFSATVVSFREWLFDVAYTVERINREVSTWIRSSAGDYEESPQMPFIATRGYDSVGKILRDTLEAAGAKAMVVGHTLQLSAEYDCCIWKVDVGMASGVIDSRPDVFTNFRPEAFTNIHR